ncbi:hypothetical protein BGAL_0033g00450 [Botrytis galanthina]|uniref:Uncharacterized protein n=1 Tax=Botrytis galanthina TaxID=278940 RepID=A0A4S8RAP9_9HELO|nr:hypothetical protein BGAL_0033g00450 [Botrytis galanthina]
MTIKQVTRKEVSAQSSLWRLKAPSNACGNYLPLGHPLVCNAVEVGGCLVFCNLRRSGDEANVSASIDEVANDPITISSFEIVITVSKTHESKTLPWNTNKNT